ncbi:MAG: hypothetical protein DYH08_07775 [Actinobacteria bacterium ATB1]|nr:hypothetical protein [Actinobacteria bacterium ATB1]
MLHVIGDRWQVRKEDLCLLVRSELGDMTEVNHRGAPDVTSASNLGKSLSAVTTAKPSATA